MSALTFPGLVVLQPDPLLPDRGRELFAVPAPVTVRQWLDEYGIDEFFRPTVCAFNGQPLMRADWATAVIGPADEIRFTTLAYAGGGGGGGGGKSPLKIVLSIAVMAVGMIVAAPLAGAMGFTQATAFTAFGQSISWMTIGKAIVGGAITMLGNALVSSILPSASPSKAATSWGQSSYGSPPAASPTYSLSAQGNQARLGQPIPEIFGRHITYPDLCGDPYQEYVDNEQFLFQLHCIGVGQFETEPVKIDDTPVANFSEIQTEIIPSGGTVTLVETNVVTASEVAGQELIATNELASGEDGWIGPFTAAPAETAAATLGFDMVCPRGLYYANDQGSLETRTVTWVVEIQEIDDDGIAAGNYIQVGSESLSGATTTAMRRSYRYTVAVQGRYQARARRTDSKDTSSRAGHELRWVALRSYLTQQPNFGDVTLLAIKAKATDQLSNRSSRLVNLVVTRKLPQWHPVTGWSEPVATRSIAWAAAYLSRAQNAGNLADARVNFSQLYTLDQTWASRGDYADGIFDTTTTVWEALQRTLRAGRAMPIDELGSVRFLRDEAKTLPTMTFTPRDIVKGSVEVGYLTPDDTTADKVKLEFFYKKTWKPKTITCTLPESDAEKPVTVQLPMVSELAQAEREGKFMVADNRYRRIHFTFTTHRGGLIPRYGDPVAIIHPLARVGQGGEVLDWDAESDILTLSEPVKFTVGEPHYIALVGRNGMQSSAVEVEVASLDLATGRASHVRVLGDLNLEPYTGGEAERTRYCFGPASKLYRLGLVRGAVPRGNHVQLICVAEDARVHVN